jgi:hypothetical protein
MDFRIVCLSCWQLTKYDALGVDHSGQPCDKCGAIL